MTEPTPRRHDRPTPGCSHLPTRVVAGQVDTDYDPEGILLPAQRTAVEWRAAELDAEIVGEYVENY